MEVKALSVKQPWAWLICAGLKDVENRNWYTQYRGRCYVHTGIKIDKRAFEWLADRFPECLYQRVIVNGLINPSVLVTGAIIGEVEIVDCVEKSESHWFTGRHGFVLRNPVLYEVPVPCRGKLRFFEPDVRGWR